MDRRVVITGAGLIGPLGNRKETLWDELCAGRSGIDFLNKLPRNDQISPFGGEARQFSGDIGDYGQLEKPLVRAIKKGRKLMCREIEMGVASAQLALQDAQLAVGDFEPERTGVLFGSDYIMTDPHEFLRGVSECRDEQGGFDFSRWGQAGLSKVEPLWLLKYLPNMPASHIAIYNDLRGPSNSITMREASSALSIAEAFTTIRRGAADRMVAGATGTRIHRVRSIHVNLQEQLAHGDDPTQASRPFEKDRSGMVIGEGAGALIMESLESAESRGATILGEVIAHASTCASSRPVRPTANTTVRDAVASGRYQQAFENAYRQLLTRSGLAPEEISYISAHGISTTKCDHEEALAINRVFGKQKPVVALKSATGNLGAGSGVIEIIANLMAFKAGHLFPTQNYQTPDPDCPIHVVTSADHPAGDHFLICNITPQGQCSGLVIRKPEP